MTARKVYLVRHPETDWNAQGRYQGRTDRPLTRCGAASVQSLVDYFRDRVPLRVVSSPAAHARAAANEIAAALTNGGGAVVDEAWAEIDHGDWEGLDFEQVTTRFGPGARGRFDEPLDYRDHGGETLRAAESRIARAWRVLASEAGDTVVVCHVTPIRLVLCQCLDLPAMRQWRFRIDNSGVTGLSVTDDDITIDFLNLRTGT